MRGLWEEMKEYKRRLKGDGMREYGWMGRSYIS